MFTKTSKEQVAQNIHMQLLMVQCLLGEKSLIPPGPRDVQGTGLTGKAKVMDRFAQGKRYFNKVYLS